MLRADLAQRVLRVCEGHTTTYFGKASGKKGKITPNEKRDPQVTPNPVHHLHEVQSMSTWRNGSPQLLHCSIKPCKITKQEKPLKLSLQQNATEAATGDLTFWRIMLASQRSGPCLGPCPCAKQDYLNKRCLPRGDDFGAKGYRAIIPHDSPSQNPYLRQAGLCLQPTH